MTENEPTGLPIYLDPTARTLADSMHDPQEAIDGWFPSNQAAHKLWRCHEAMLDLEAALEPVGHAKNATKRKRRLKIAITPLHALITCLDDLLNDIENNPETRNRLKPGQAGDIPAIRTAFQAVLPHDHQSPVSQIRNKLSSHIDRRMHTAEAQALASQLTSHEFGRWLHICLNVVLDLTKLEIYAWSCRPPADGYVTCMHFEPYIVTLKIEGADAPAIAGVNISSASPRNALSDAANRLVVLSRWMFKAGQARIGGFTQDEPHAPWNSFARNVDVFSAGRDPHD